MLNNTNNSNHNCHHNKFNSNYKIHNRINKEQNTHITNYTSNHLITKQDPPTPKLSRSLGSIFQRIFPSYSWIIWTPPRCLREQHTNHGGPVPIQNLLSRFRFRVRHPWPSFNARDENTNRPFSDCICTESRYVVPSSAYIRAQSTSSRTITLPFIPDKSNQHVSEMHAQYIDSSDQYSGW